jgi:hypothetical protein
MRVTCHEGQSSRAGSYRPALDRRLIGRWEPALRLLSGRAKMTRGRIWLLNAAPTRMLL